MQLICAPIATLTHAGFRTLVERFGGCDEHYTEMINAGSFVTGGPFEKYYVIPGPAPEKVVWQLTGKDAHFMAAAAEMLSQLPGAGIDLNMGCSAPEIVRSGAGAAWMMKPAEETRGMVRAVKKAAGDRRLSVKLRLGGEDYTDEGFFSFTDMLVDEGVTRLALHARTAKEKYRLPPRWEYVEKLALRYEGRGVEVVLNGNVKDAESLAAAVKAAPHASGIMIARGAAEYPWIFAQLRSSLEGARRTITIDREQTALDFIGLVQQYQPEEFWKTRLQRFFAYYCLGFSFAHYFQTQMLNAKDCDDARARVQDYFTRESGDRIKTITA